MATDIKEIIFWFSSHTIKNYWLEYTMDFLGKRLNYDAIFKYSRIEDWIQIRDLRIKFKVDKGENSPEHRGLGNINQYWVEELFDNNFEEFFVSIMKEEMDDGKEGRN